MAVTPTAKNLRKQIGDVGFEYHVRRWRDGEIWVCAEYGNTQRNKVLLDRLAELGYLTVMHGKVGTSGENIINITGRKDIGHFYT